MGSCMRCRGLHVGQTRRFDATPTPNDWREKARCAGVDTDLFFPSKADGNLIDAVQHMLCQRCPVVAECAREALALPFPTGIWAGIFVPEQHGRKRALDKLQAIAATLGVAS